MAGEKAVGIDKIAPAISPIFGNNPGYHLFEYDLKTGDPTDFSTWNLTNLDQAANGVAAEWRQEYTFTQAYGQTAYSAVSVDQLTRAAATRDALRLVDPDEPTELADEALAADRCAILHLEASSFGTCFCRNGGE
jgi:hypothetical protein